MGGTGDAWAVSPDEHLHCEGDLLIFFIEDLGDKLSHIMLYIVEVLARRDDAIGVYDLPIFVYFVIMEKYPPRDLDRPHAVPRLYGNSPFLVEAHNDRLVLVDAFLFKIFEDGDRFFQAMDAFDRLRRRVQEGICGYGFDLQEFGGLFRPGMQFLVI